MVQTAEFVIGYGDMNAGTGKEPNSVNRENTMILTAVLDALSDQSKTQKNNNNNSKKHIKDTF